MNLKQTVQSTLSPDSRLYRFLALLYRYRSPHTIKRAIMMRWHKDSRFDSSELWMASLCPTPILEAVIEKWHPRSFLDVGCGTGQAMQYLLQKGIDCVGLEGSEAAIAASPVAERIRCVNLNDAVRLERKFDLVWSYEVAEHIHPRFVEWFLDTLTGHGDTVVMSAAQPGQGGAGHFNLQAPAYWIAKLRQRNFVFLKDFTESLHQLDSNVCFCRNMMAFQREPDAP